MSKARVYTRCCQVLKDEQRLEELVARNIAAIAKDDERPGSSTSPLGSLGKADAEQTTLSLHMVVRSGYDLPSAWSSKTAATAAGAPSGLCLFWLFGFAAELYRAT